MLDEFCTAYIDNILIYNNSKKNIIFYWTPEYQKSFELFKEYFTTAPILVYFDFEKECILESDSSDNVSTRILS